MNSRFGEVRSPDLPRLTITADRLWAGDGGLAGPLAFVDLGSAGEWPAMPELPPFPVIGLGEPSHPLAGLLDAVIQAPIGAETVTRQVLTQPAAAAVVTQLLRILPALSADAGLTAESLAYGLLQGSSGHRAWIEGNADGDVTAGERRVRLGRNGDHLTVTMDHPAGGNAIDRTMRDGLYEAFALAALDQGIRRVSLRSVGRAFSLGSELAEFGTTRDPATAHGIRMETLPARMLARCADRLEVHVQGGCVGAGLEMAAWGSRVTAAPDAWFQLPELAMGVLPGAGGCVSLTRRIGRQRTALLVLSGKRINARTALDWGLIDAIVDQPA